jgi:hypothetical protein
MYKFEYNHNVDLNNLREHLAANAYKSRELQHYYTEVQKHRDRGNLYQVIQIIQEHLEYKKRKLLTDSNTELTPNNRASVNKIKAANSVQNILRQQLDQDLNISSTITALSDDEIEMQQPSSSNKILTRGTFQAPS